MAINKITPADIETLRHYPELNVYQSIAIRSAVYPGQGTGMGLVYCSLKLAGEAGELSQHIGKAMRDDGFVPALSPAYGPGTLRPERREALVKELGDVLWYVSALAKELDIFLSEVARMNLVKLADRTKREKLQGSGDDR